MSKRTRGPARTTHRRPGTRPPTTRSGVRPTTSRPPLDALAPSELETAAEVAEDMAQARSVPAAEASRPALRGAHARTRVKAGSLLAARAATEYVYVAEDIKRILLVSGTLFGIMLALYVLIVVARVIPLPFY